MSASSVQRTERFQLTLLALAAESIYLMVAFVPLLPLIGLQTAVYGVNGALWIGAALLLGLWWLIQPNTDLGTDYQELPSDSPLYKVMHDLCRRSNAPKVHRIVLTNDINAAAYQSGGFLSLVGVRRTLLIGVPLLRLVNANEAMAVIAHELGHFSRNHGHLGHWIYRVNAKWHRFIYAHPDNDGRFEKPLRWLAAWFIPYFLQRSARWSRHCEFEADQNAASLGLGAELITGLLKINQVNAFLNEQFRLQLQGQNFSSPVGPSNYWELLIRSLHQCVSSGGAPDALDLPLVRRASREYDSHPPCAERFAALNLPRPQLDWATMPCAGQALLGDAWDAVYLHCQTQWLHEFGPGWRLNYFTLQWCQMRLDELRLLQHRNEMEQIESAAMAAYLTPTPDAKAALCSIAQRYSHLAYACYEQGMSLLRQESVEGLALLRQAVKLDKAYVPAATYAIYAFQHQFGSHEQATQARMFWHNALKWTARHCDGLWTRLLEDELRPIGLATRRIFRQALVLEPSVDAAWVVQLDSKVDHDVVLTINVIVVRLDPQSLVQEGMEEEQAMQRYTEFLQSICRPAELVRVFSFYTTEPIQPKLLQQLRRDPEFCVVEPKAAVNESLVRIDSL